MSELPEKPNELLSLKTKLKKLECYISDKFAGVVADDIRQKVCVNDEPIIKHSDNNYYCLFHLPDKNKDINKFYKILETRVKMVETQLTNIKDLSESEQTIVKSDLRYDFRGVWFCWCDFSSYHFLVEANFRSATFCYGAVFKSAKFLAKANFRWASFLDSAIFDSVEFSTTVDFIGITFYDLTVYNNTIFFDVAKFNQANFEGLTSFDNATFKSEANFSLANLGEKSEISFSQTKFLDVLDLAQTNIKGYFSFSGKQNEQLFNGEKSSLNLQNTRINNSKEISFHTVLLRPNWFVNVDSRKFVFTDITWKNIDSDYKNKNIERECKSLEKLGINEQKKRLLEIAVRQLAVNAEENNRYDEAAKFRYMAMETKRLEDKSQFFLFWLYKQSSEYGESWIRAFYWLILIWIYFALVYWLIGEFQDDKTISFLESFGYSLQVMTLQKPEPRPSGWFTILYYGLETILAPLQAALLALAIRRKFMR